MTDVVDQWKTVADLWGGELGAIGDRWGSPTPCEGWTVRDLVDHAVGVQLRLLDAAGAEGVAGTALSDDDPAGDWRGVVERGLAAMRAPGALERSVPTPMGERPLGQAIGIPTLDLMVHTWDLATALGRQVRLPEDMCEHALAQLTPMDAMIRAAGMFGPKVEVPADADVQTRLIAFCGRHP